MQYTDQMIEAMLTEIRLRASTIQAPLQTIYFGGGTPSLLSAAQVSRFFQTINNEFEIEPEAEITFECNPDDLSEDTLETLKSNGVNRLSIGVQSFNDVVLKKMNRIHHAAAAESAIQLAVKKGFQHLTIDLIYGIPGVSDEQLLSDLKKAAQFGIQHISAYCLTIEPDTALHHLIQKGKYLPTDEEHALRQFELLCSFLSHAGFEQYEISNFARDGAYSKHNTAYWQRKPYLGIGPSAHSFNGQERSWNIADNQAYLRSMSQGIVPSEKELLSLDERYNEAIMTGLRTIWGCDLTEMKLNFPEQMKASEKRIAYQISLGMLQLENGFLKLSQAGKFLADGIAADLFV